MAGSENICLQMLRYGDWCDFATLTVFSKSSEFADQRRQVYTEAVTCGFCLKEWNPCTSKLLSATLKSGITPGDECFRDRFRQAD